MPDYKLYDLFFVEIMIRADIINNNKFINADFQLLSPLEVIPFLWSFLFPSPSVLENKQEIIGRCSEPLISGFVREPKRPLSIHLLYRLCWS